MMRIVTLARVVWLETLRRKDVYVLLVLLAAMLGALLSLNLYGLGGVVRYLKDTGLLLSLVLSWILAVGVTARQLPQEEMRGTIHPLLAKPVTRAELILGKWLGGWLVVCAATALFYLLVLLVVAHRGGRLDAITLLQTFVLHAAGLAVLCALALCLSTRTTFGAAASLAAVVIGAAYMIAPRVPALIVAQTGWRASALRVLYYAVPHLELFDLRQRAVHDWGAAPWPPVLGALVYAAVWTALLLLLAWLGYRNKRFLRGTAR